MPNVTGSLVYDSSRNNNATSPGIANIEIVLQDVNSKMAIAVMTDSSGNYTFINVPAGSYQVLEDYGYGPVSSTGNFSEALLAPLIDKGKVPPISVITSPPAGATNLDGVTRLASQITVGSSDVTVPIIRNGPVDYAGFGSKLDSHITVEPTNLFPGADSGTFGTLPIATPENTVAPSNPYPEIKSDFLYHAVVPSDVLNAGEFMIVNDSNATTRQQNDVGWWKLADHTTGDERGRLMMVNGDNPGSVILQGTIPVTKNGNYLLSTWIANLNKSTGFADPALSIEVTNSAGQTLYNQNLGGSLSTNPNMPVWFQAGDIINVGNSDSVTVKIISRGSAGGGNDFVIDDIQFSKADIPLSMQPVKNPSAPITGVDNVVTYTSQIQNTFDRKVTNVKFLDTLPNGLSFVPGSVKVGGVSVADDPTVAPGVTLPDMDPGQTVTVTFDARVNAIPIPNPAINTARTTFDYNYISDNSPTGKTVLGNDSPVTVQNTADVTSTKTADKKGYLPGDTINYTIHIANAGPSSAPAPVVSDAVPPSVENPEYSVNGGTTWAPWTGSVTLADLMPGGTADVLIRGTVKATATVSDSIANVATITTSRLNKNGDTNAVKADTNNSPAGNPVVLTPAQTRMQNRAAVSSPTPNKTGGTNSIIVSTTDSTGGDPVIVLTADVTSTKTSDKASYLPGEVATYTVTVANGGPSIAKAPTVSDTVPSNVTNPEFSTDGGTSWNPWTGSTTLTDIASGATATVLIRGTVSSTATGSLANEATTTTPTPDKNGNPNTVTAKTADSAGGDPTVVPTGDLVTTVTSDNPNPKPGDTVTYTVDVKNNGPATADSPKVSYTVPPQLKDVQYSTDGGATWQPWTGDTTLANIPSGDTSKLLIKGTVDPTATGTIPNTFTTTSPTNDPNTADNTASIDTPVVQTGDLVTTVTSDNPSPKPGDTVTYTVDVKNNGPATADSPKVSYTVPPQLKDVQYSTDGGATWQPWLGDVTLANIPNGDTSKLLIKGTVDPTATGTIPNAFTTTSPTNDPNTADNTATVDTPVVQTGDLVTTVTSDNPNPKPGDTVTYTVDVKNNGPATADSPKVSYTVPPQLKDVQYSTDGGVTWTPWPGDVTLANIPNGDTSKLLIKGMVDKAATGTIPNTFTTTSPTNDPNTADNTATVDTPVTPVGDLVTTVTSDNPNPKPGDTVTYTVDVKNNGPATADSPKVSYTVPPQLKDVQYSTDGGVTWQPWPGDVTLANIPNGDTSKLLIKGTLDKAATGTIPSTFTTTSPTADSDTTNNTATATTDVVPTSDLVTTVTSDNPSPRPGDTVTYTVDVKNNGPATADSPKVSYTVPPQLKDVQYSTDGGVTWQPWPGDVTLANIPNGDTSKLLIKGTLDKGATGTIPNTFTTTSPTADSDTTNNTATATTDVVPTSDLVTTVTSDNPSPKPGDTVTYTVDVKNNGPATADSPKVSYIVPPQLKDVQYSTDGGATWQPWPGDVMLADIPNGDTSKLLIKGTLDPNATGTIPNTFSVASPTMDMKPSDNAASLNTAVAPTSELALTLTVDNPAPKPGEKLTYTVNVKNNGPATVPNPTLTLVPPSNLKNIEVSLDDGVTWNPWREGGVTRKALSGGIMLPDLANGVSSNVLIRGVVDLANVDPINISVTVSSQSYDPILPNNRASLTTPVTPVANLTTEVTVDKPSPLPGETVTYTVTLTNGGPSTAASPHVSLVPPAVLTEVMYSLDGGATWAPWNGETTLSSIPAALSAKVLIRGKLPTDATGDLTAYVLADTVTYDPNMKDNVAANTTPITPTSGLSTTITVDNASPKPGDTVTFNIMTKNNGPSDAMSPALTAKIPPELTNVEYSLDGGATWLPWTGSTKITDIPNGNTAQTLIRGTLATTAIQMGAITATVTSSNYDPNSGDNTGSASVTVLTKKHLVKFYDRCCVLLDYTEVYDGRPLVRPAEPGLPCHTFVGWYTDRSLCTPWDFGTPITYDLNLFAKWVRTINY